MEDSKINNIEKDMKSWLSSTEEVSKNLTNFVNEIKGDLSPEDKEKVDNEMKNLDMKSFRDEIDKAMGDVFKKFKG